MELCRASKSSSEAYHMLTPSHQPLVYDFSSIIAACINVDAFFHDRVRASSQRLAGLVTTWLDLWRRPRRLWCLIITHAGRCCGEVGSAGQRHFKPGAGSLDTYRGWQRRDKAGLNLEQECRSTAAEFYGCGMSDVSWCWVAKRLQRQLSEPKSKSPRVQMWYGTEANSGSKC